MQGAQTAVCVCLCERDIGRGRENKSDTVSQWVVNWITEREKETKTLEKSEKSRLSENITTAKEKAPPQFQWPPHDILARTATWIHM